MQLYKIYKIYIGSQLDASTECVLVVSHEPLTKDNINIEAIAGIKKDSYYDTEYIVAVQIANIKINPNTEEEANEQVQFINLLNY